MNKNYIEFGDIKIEDLHRWNEVERKEAEDYMCLIYVDWWKEWYEELRIIH